jgi:hypothetical protein
MKYCVVTIGVTVVEAAVRPGMATPFSYHWKLIGELPRMRPVIVADWPAAMVALAGCCWLTGGSQT